MSRKHRIKSSKLQKSRIQIGFDPSQIKRLAFSFRHLDLSKEKFSIRDRDHQYFGKVLGRLKALSALDWDEICAIHSKDLRAHPIDWATTTEPKGFSHLNAQLRETTAFQFSVSANEHGRVHGFCVDNVFFVVWFDPLHNLYRKR